MSRFFEKVSAHLNCLKDDLNHVHILLIYFYPFYSGQDIRERMGAAQIEGLKRNSEDLSRPGGIDPGFNLRYAHAETHHTNLISWRMWTATTGTSSGHLETEGRAKKGDKWASRGLFHKDLESSTFRPGKSQNKSLCVPAFSVCNILQTI